MMYAMRVRTVSEGELSHAETLLDGIPLADEALVSLARLGCVEPTQLSFGDGWAAVAEVDGTSLLARGEPTGEGARWTISVNRGAENAMHAARKLCQLVEEGQERRRPL